LVLIKYKELTEFQKWVFFYLALYDTIPKNMKGVMPKMCSGLKMKVDLEDFDKHEQIFQKESATLFDNGLLENTTIKVQHDSYKISPKGEIYILQKIMGPIIIANDKHRIKEIQDYFISKDNTVVNQIYDMFATIKKESFIGSFKTLATKAMNDFTPFITALDKLHDVAHDFGLDGTS
jgi:hypothetical protein